MRFSYKEVILGSSPSGSTNTLMNNLHSIKPPVLIPAGFRAFAHEKYWVPYAWLSSAQIMINLQNNNQVNPQMEEFGGSVFLREYYRNNPQLIPSNLTVRD